MSMRMSHETMLRDPLSWGIPWPRPIGMITGWLISRMRDWQLGGGGIHRYSSSTTNGA